MYIVRVERSLFIDHSKAFRISEYPSDFHSEPNMRVSLDLTTCEPHGLALSSQSCLRGRWFSEPECIDNIHSAKNGQFWKAVVGTEISCGGSSLHSVPDALTVGA